MADTVLTVFPSDETLRRLPVAAEAAGLSVEACAAQILERALADDGVKEDAAVFQSAHDWTEADRRLAEYDRTGEYVDADEALDAFVASVDARAARR